MRNAGIIACAALAASVCAACGAEPEEWNVPRGKIHVRDPFVVPDPEAGIYRIYASRPWSGGDGVCVRKSRDLENWSAGEPALYLPPDFKRDVSAYWAPEVHKYRDAWYMFVTLHRKNFKMGTWIFRSEKPDGPFKPVSDKAATPPEWACLDGTLWVEDGKPYMVFCHEWTQAKNGEMCLIPLKDDLSGAAGAPKLLFRATDYADGPLPKPRQRHLDRVTDGPFLYRSDKNGKLYMIWSNVTSKHGYTEILCESATGKIAGPWKNFRILFGKDGGHGMLFRKLDGGLTLTLHSPNGGGRERMRFMAVEDTGDGLRIAGADARRPAPAVQAGGKQ